MPAAGTQPEPHKNRHNSGWVQCPGAEILKDTSRHDELKTYVTGIMERFRNDERILVWDLYNEPGNTSGGRFEGIELKPDEVVELQLKQAQITSGVVLSKQTGEPINQAEIYIMMRSFNKGTHSGGGSRFQYEQ